MIIINYNGGKCLAGCLDSTFCQSLINKEVIVIDNNSSDKSMELLKAYKSNNDVNMEVISNSINLGYSGAANQGIGMAEGEFVVVMNPDIVMEEDFLEKCYDFIKTYETIAVVSGKLLKYDFDNNSKLKIIDSTGIGVTAARKFYDRGQNKFDIGQYENSERVFAVCGAVPFYRKSILEKVKLNDEYYDEDFFAYKEDIDFCWGLNLYSYKCMYCPAAVAYHGRGMNSAENVVKTLENRKQQSQFLRGISFRNHYLMLIKNETGYSWKRDRIRIIFRLITFIIYSVFFERFNLKYVKEIKALWPKFKLKRQLVQQNAKIPMKEFFELFKESL